eukprot:m.100720 g.100720  ORF g.100720 m.100720 type:complete len:91 (-) comp12554_c0_seq12:1088-1360(-)
MWKRSSNLQKPKDPFATTSSDGLEVNYLEQNRAFENTIYDNHTPTMTTTNDTYDPTFEPAVMDDSATQYTFSKQPSVRLTGNSNNTDEDV